MEFARWRTVFSVPIDRGSCCPRGLEVCRPSISHFRKEVVPRGKEGGFWNLKRGTTGNGGTITFILSLIKITTLPHRSQNYNKISAAGKQGRTGPSSSQFILSRFDV